MNASDVANGRPSEGAAEKQREGLSGRTQTVSSKQRQPRFVAAQTIAGSATRPPLAHLEGATSTC